MKESKLIEVRNQSNKEHLLIISNSFLNAYLRKSLCDTIFIVGMYSNNLVTHHEVVKIFDSPM